MTDPGRRLVVLRHGETDDNAAGVWQGHRDSALSPRGRTQARAAAPLVAALRPDVIVSSDLRRAADTADAVAALLDLPVRRDPRLREIDVGEWGGRTAAQVRESDAVTLRAIADGVDARRGRTGETVAELAARAREAADDLVAELAPAGTALVVCHGVTSRALVASLVGLDQGRATQLLRGLGNCCWATVREVHRPGPDGAAAPWRIEAWNVGTASAAPPVTGPGATDLGGGHAIG